MGGPLLVAGVPLFDDLVCPISNHRIDRNVVRVSGLVTTLLLVAYVVTRSPWIIVPLGLDYAVRTLLDGPTSPLGHVARALAKALRLPYRAMDTASKGFASRIGVCFAMGAAVAHFVAPGAAPWLAGTLAVFPCLESVFDFCRGWFGEMALLDGQPRVASVRAVTPVTALRLARAPFEALLARYPDMRERMERTAAERKALQAAQLVP